LADTGVIQHYSTAWFTYCNPMLYKFRIGKNADKGGWNLFQGLCGIILEMGYEKHNTDARIILPRFET